MAFVADYKGAIVVEARNYGYTGSFNNPKAWCLHTPEEPPDDVPSTPYYFANTNVNASTHYFVSFLGLVFQMVPERHGAYGNAVQGKPYPNWANSAINLNLQTLSIEIEGYAATIHQTMVRGGSQWRALVNLMADRCIELRMPVERTIGHYDVSIYRSDPGALNIPLLILDVQAKIKQLTAPPPPPPPVQEVKEMILVKTSNDNRVFAFDGATFSHIPGGAFAEAAWGHDWATKVQTIPHANKKDPRHPYGDAKLPVFYPRGSASE